jgi:HEPN domain-containing protein
MPRNVSKFLKKSNPRLTSGQIFRPDIHRFFCSLARWKGHKHRVQTVAMDFWYNHKWPNYNQKYAQKCVQILKKVMTGQLQRQIFRSYMHGFFCSQACWKGHKNRVMSMSMDFWCGNKWPSYNQKYAQKCVQIQKKW